MECDAASDLTCERDMVLWTYPYLSTFENFPGVESARQLVSDILPIARGRYK